VIKGISLVCTGCGNATVLISIYLREAIIYFQPNRIFRKTTLKGQHSISSKGKIRGFKFINRCKST
jgi:DNA-binding CsgD family transcriptional regulator